MTTAGRETRPHTSIGCRCAGCKAYDSNFYYVDVTAGGVVITIKRARVVRVGT